MNRHERRRARKVERVPTTNAPEPTDDTRTTVMAFPANGRCYLYFACATKCAAAGRTLPEALTSDLESLHFTPEQTRELAVGLFRVAELAEAGRSIDIAAELEAAWAKTKAGMH